MLHVVWRNQKIYMCVVNRVATGFHTAYHHVKVVAENENSSPKIKILTYLSAIVSCSLLIDNG